MGLTLIELCAGSAAVSMAWLGHQPPLGWQGGKRAFAGAILRAAGLGRLDALRTDGEVVLCEPGPWGEVWALWRAQGTAGTVERLLAWNTRDPSELWLQLSAAPPPFDLADRVAVWCVLQFWSYGSKPVVSDGSRWRTHGFHAEGPYRSEVAARKRAQGLTKYRTGRDQRLHLLAQRIEALNLSRVRAVYRQIADVPLQPGAITYLDPPYVGTSCPYGHALPRPQVLELALARAAAGELVLVSEAEPLPLPGWHHLMLPPPIGRGRNNFTAQRAEWLTMCPAFSVRSSPAALVLPGF